MAKLLCKLKKWTNETFLASWHACTNLIRHYRILWLFLSKLRSVASLMPDFLMILATDSSGTCWKCHINAEWISNCWYHEYPRIATNASANRSAQRWEENGYPTPSWITSLSKKDIRYWSKTYSHFKNQFDIFLEVLREKLWPET